MVLAFVFVVGFVGFGFVGFVVDSVVGSVVGFGSLRVAGQPQKCSCLWLSVHK